MLQTSIPAETLLPGTWLVDPKAGHIRFRVKNLWGLVDVKGTFERYEGALHVTEEGASGQLIIHADTLDTKNRKRDEHLRSADFFDAAAHPQLVFTATAVRPVERGLVVSGILEVGSTRTLLELPAVVVDETEDGALDIRASVRIPRADVGLTWNKAGMIKGDARVEVDLRLLAPA